MAAVLESFDLYDEKIISYYLCKQIRQIRMVRNTHPRKIQLPTVVHRHISLCTLGQSKTIYTRNSQSTMMPQTYENNPMIFSPPVSKPKFHPPPFQNTNFTLPLFRNTNFSFHCWKHKFHPLFRNKTHPPQLRNTNFTPSFETQISPPFRNTNFTLPRFETQISRSPVSKHKSHISKPKFHPPLFETQISPPPVFNPQFNTPCFETQISPPPHFKPHLDSSHQAKTTLATKPIWTARKWTCVCSSERLCMARQRGVSSVVGITLELSRDYPPSFTSFRRIVTHHR